MTATYYTVTFDFENQHYEGRLSPEYKKSSQDPSSWHVVLNDVFFGYMHKDGGQWEVTEQRPAGLTERVGALIDAKDYQQHEA